MNKIRVNQIVLEKESTYDEAYEAIQKVITVFLTFNKPMKSLQPDIDAFLSKNKNFNVFSLRLYIDSVFTLYEYSDKELIIDNKLFKHQCRYTRKEINSFLDTLDSLPYKMTIRQYIENKYLDSDWKEYKGDILITDPCYLIKHEDWGCSNLGKFLPSIMHRDTIYGDWSCTVFERPLENAKILGTFCADAGEVCVVLKSDVERYNPECLEKISANCYWCTTIHNFDGLIRFEVDEHFAVDLDSNSYLDHNVQVIGKGNINFESRQTGL